MSRRTGETIYKCDRCGAEAVLANTKGWRKFRFAFNGSLVDFESRLGDSRDYCPTCVDVVTLTLKRRV